jgi:hypothetical protein
MDYFISFEVISEEMVEWAVGIRLADALSYSRKIKFIARIESGCMSLFSAQDQGTA